MTADIHERACKLALSARLEDLASADRDWLDQHLSACPACSQYHESLERTLGAVRAAAPTAGDALVRTTQLRVRQRAAELRARDAAMRPLWIASVMVFLSTLVSTPLLWKGFAWMGRVAQVSDFTWRSAFVLLWVTPAIAASLLLLAHGAHLARWRQPQFSPRGEQ